MPKKSKPHNTKGNKVSKLFSGIAKKISQIVGNAWTFMCAVSIIIVWLLTEPILVKNFV